MTDSYGATCFICGERYWNDNETHITIRRVVRNYKGVKTMAWEGDVCDGCLMKHFGFETGDDEDDR